MVRSGYEESRVVNLLDANVLIDANRLYYPMDRVPEFWLWLVAMGEQGSIKIPAEVYDKVAEADDDLSRWLKDHKDTLILDEMVDRSMLVRVVEEGYASDLDDVEQEKLNEDPFLIAYALADPQHRRVVTTERSRPSAMRANRKVPDVCNHFNVTCYDTFTLIRELDFRTDWRSG